MAALPTPLRQSRPSRHSRCVHCLHSTRPNLSPRHLGARLTGHSPSLCPRSALKLLQSSCPGVWHSQGLEGFAFMKQYATESIRNLVLIGHGGTGGTSPAPAALFVSGGVNRPRR